MYPEYDKQYIAKTSNGNFILVFADELPRNDEEFYEIESHICYVLEEDNEWERYILYVNGAENSQEFMFLEKKDHLGETISYTVYSCDKEEDS